ncbi:MAG: hypothetical protein II782_01720 [Oscillospiraceae bacterium]|nr:hypothetical protein [Oscillospiraceae bacterium]
MIPPQSSAETADTAMTETEGVTDTVEETTVTTKATEADPVPQLERAAPVKLDSPENISAFVSGKWFLEDTKTGEDYASFDIAEDGTTTFTRLSDGFKASGTLVFETDDTDSMAKTMRFMWTCPELSTEVLPEDQREYYEAGTMEDTASGLCYIGRTDGEDLLYMEEVGNGDSMSSYYLFAAPSWDESRSRRYNFHWVLHRENGVRVDEPIKKDKEFYALCWRHENGEVLLQELDHNEETVQDDYSERRYIAGNFASDTVHLSGAAEYDLSDRISDENFLYPDTWDREMPVAVYKVCTDDKGTVISMDETDRFYYGKYQFGLAEPEISYEGTTFIYNDAEYVLSEYGMNQIMGTEQVGDKIVIEGHVNPHWSVYAVFDLYSGRIDPLVGANLTWYNDDIYTCLYSKQNDVMNYSGDVLFTAPGEVFDIHFSDDRLQAEIEYADPENPNIMLTSSFDLPYEDDEAKYLYEDFMFDRLPSKWRRFMEFAPKNAGMFIITEPSENILSFMGYPVREDIAGDAQQVVMAVSLYDDAKIQLRHGTYDASSGGVWKDSGSGEEYELEKGAALAYYVDIPEGVPENYIHLYTDDIGIDWNVTTISGQYPQTCTFVQVEAMG